jgi:hypothetical protein
MLARSAISAATATLLALAAAQAANAQHLHGNGVEDQPSQRWASPNAHPGSALAESIAGATSTRPSVAAPTGVPGRVVPAVSTPSSPPTLQQIRR